MVQVQSLFRLTIVLIFGTTACLAALGMVISKLVASSLPGADYKDFRFVDQQQSFPAGIVALMTVFFAFGGQVHGCSVLSTHSTHSMKLMRLFLQTM